MTLRTLLLCLATAVAGSAAIADTTSEAGTTAPTTPAKPTSANAGGPGIETGPALGWVFPVFTDKEGYHAYTLRGTAAKAVSLDEIEVTGFNAIVFSGDATERVDTVLMSPQATFFPKQNRAAGGSSVRLIHDDIEVIGRGWTYDHLAKKVSLAHDVRVTFHAQINDILK